MPTEPTLSYQSKPGFDPPRATATFGVWLFLAALFMLFAAGLLGYVVIRTTSAASPPLGAIHLPGMLWASTAALLLVSVSIHRAVVAVGRERQASFRLWLNVMAASAIGFLVLQAPAMAALLSSHHAILAGRSRGGPGLGLYGLIFFLVLVHAAHVVGGLVWLARIYFRGRRGDFDHEDHLAVRHAAMYWHFLDVVWLVMFGTFLALR